MTPSMTTIAQSENGEPLFTCLSCSIAFVSAEDQRSHYRSDHHRYNMKRRVANLPPVSAAVFNQKVLERRAETAVTTSLKGSTCEICSKVYLSENAYRSHMNSKKHRDNELQAAIALSLRKEQPPIEKPSEEVASYEAPDADTVLPSIEPSIPAEVQMPPPEPPSADDRASTNDVAPPDEEMEIEQTLDQKMAAARTHLTPLSCLFCSYVSSSLQLSLEHMSVAHGFFLPDAEYLEDIPGLLGYLGEKVAIGNVCIYCNGKGRQFHSLEAVRKHMIDKSHCKLAYDREEDRLEVSDWYNFEKSYPRKQAKAPKKTAVEVEDEEEEEWEDVEDDGEADEIIEETGSDASEDEEPAEEPITYGDSPYELVLPSGARIGHRSLKRYYDQSYAFRSPPRSSDPNSGAAVVRRLLADKQGDLVPLKGGFGAFGAGMQVVKARNRGEAREAGRHVREFRDQQKREQFRTAVGYRHNYQKHYRDPLLQ